ncbi:hypothetical protein GOC73_27865 [Sinorhizobium medicae]|nr:hypothetical protein [Sinorhizobium medicae]MDX0691721.1 hypothetical protein [Sinorhizobium medicae]
MRILTPRGHDWTHRFPAIEAAARNVHLRPIIRRSRPEGRRVTRALRSWSCVDTNGPVVILDEIAAAFLAR